MIWQTGPIQQNFVSSDELLNIAWPKKIDHFQYETAISQKYHIHRPLDYLLAFWNVLCLNIISTTFIIYLFKKND